jgi:hypothetical protein
LKNGSGVPGIKTGPFPGERVWIFRSKNGFRVPGMKTGSSQRERVHKYLMKSESPAGGRGRSRIAGKNT